jgi:iron complex outermembrane receptor protein
MKNRQFTLRHTPASRALTLACATAFASLSAGAAHAQSSPSVTAELPTVIVTANRMEQALQTAPIGATVLLGDDIRASGVLDANEAVRKLGGVSGRTDLNGGREFSIDLRGYGEAASQNLVVVVDGIRITQIDLASARLSSIAPEMIERIEIIRGGASVVWGEGAAGGVISVTTKNGKRKGLSGSVSLGLESFNGRDTQARVDLVGDAGSFNVNARQYRTDGYRDNSANEQTTFSLGGATTLGNLNVRLGYTNDNQDARFPGPLTSAQFLTNPQQTVKPNEYGLVKESRSSANLNYRLGPFQAFLDLGQRKRNTDNDFSGFVSKGSSESKQISPRLVFDANGAGALFTSILGYDYNSAKAGTVYSGSNESARQTSKAWFGSVSALLASQTRMTAGARSEQFEKSAVDTVSVFSSPYNRKNNLNAWDLGVNQTFSAGFDGYARTSKSYRLANIDENRSLVQALNPAISKDLEMGIKYRKDSLQSAVRVFRQTSVDEIAYDSAIYSNVNLDPIKRTGLELDSQYKLGNGWDLSANAQYIKASFSQGVNSGKKVPLVSDITATGRVAYAINAAHRVELSAQLRSDSFVSGNFSNSCSAKVPSTTYLNARYNFNGLVAAKGWTVVAEINNLTNKSSYSFNYACTPAALYPDAGRTFNLRAKYAF